MKPTVLLQAVSSSIFPFISLSLLLTGGFSFADCKRAGNELNETKLLFALGEDLSPTEKWSPDLLSRIILEIRGPYLRHCPNPDFEKKAEHLEAIYLKKLLGTEVQGKERESLFRGLLTLKDDFEKLQAKIKTEKTKIRTFEDLKMVYPSREVFSGVVIVAESEIDLKPLKAFFKEISEKAQSPVLLMDPGTLFKVLVTDTPGVAAFIPEIAILVLSKDLVESLNPLSKVVIVHELAHVGERAAWNALRSDWKQTFSAFSGWEYRKGKWQSKVARKKRVGGDVLSELSKGSPYSILPDDRVWGLKGKKRLDGFVFEKSYQASIERNDVSEDLADSIAAYYVVPDRYCSEGKEFAIKKKNWIVKNVWKFELPPCR